jgi:hypothetical protein
MNDGLKRNLAGSGRGLIVVLSRYLLGGAAEDFEYLFFEIWWPGQDSNLILP